ncbi:MAG: PepSY1/2 domain-containing protein [Christensenellales bacterium]|jgi:spore germination protein
MTKTLKTTLNIIAWLLVAAALIALVFTQQAQAEEIEKARTRLNDTCNKSLEDLVTITNELKNALGKVQVVNSQKQYTMLLSQIWRCAGEAVNALGNLPANFAHVREANAFLVQTGDYAHTLLDKCATGQLPAEQDKTQLIALYQACSQLYDKLEQANNQGVDFAGLIESNDYYSDEETSWLQLGANTPADAGEDSTDAGNTSDSQGGTESGTGQDNTVPEKMYPTLIYDGPFSDSTEKAQPKGLGSGEVDENAAGWKAREFLGDLLGGNLNYEGRSEGRIPVHVFSGSTKDGRVIDIEITVTGGKCRLMRISKPGTQGSTPVSEAQAEADTPKPDAETGHKLAEAGKEFLKSRGYESMESTYAQYYGGTAVINYAYVQDGTLVYPDLVKVWVDVTNGSIAGFEANNYLFSHVDRNIDKPAISEEDARAKVNPDLKVESVRVALIPRGLVEEKLCYEFKCTFNEESYIIFINAMTGVEEQVYKIIDSENGQLVV